MSTFYSFPANFGYFNLRANSFIPSFPTQELLDDEIIPIPHLNPLLTRPIYFPCLESLIDDAIFARSNILHGLSTMLQINTEAILNDLPRMRVSDDIVERATSVLNAPPRMMMVDDLEEVLFGRVQSVVPVWAETLRAQMRQRTILNLFHGYGMVLDEEGMRRWFEELGIPWPDNTAPPTTYLTTRSLIKGAKTLRQRAFSQLFNGCNIEDKRITLSHTNISKHEIDPVSFTARGLIAACRRDKKIRKELSKLPISRPPAHSNANDELIGPLQDLADIIAHEIKLAYTESYYPGVVDVDPLTDEHVEQIMTGMQREIDREQRISPELGEDG
ncbi:hypothetical protein LCGC14_2284200, partial [marine sediment metagenome]